MGELAEDFRFMDEARREHRAKVEPDRMKYAEKLLNEAGYRTERIDHQTLLVNGWIKLWVFTGWYSGKKVGSGRGVHNLLKKMQEVL